MSPRSARARTLLAATLALAPGAAASQSAPATLAPQRSDSIAALHRADSCWAAGDHPAARAAYTAAVRGDSTQSRAVFRLATLLAWSGRSAEAIPLYQRYRRLEPRDVEGTLAQARAQAWGGRYADAITLDDSVSALDPTNRAAVLDAAQVLVWAGRSQAALGRYRAWLRAHPDDGDAELALARALSWTGRLREAARIYDRRAAAGSVEAAKGRARVAGWRGDRPRSLALWDSLARVRASDPEVWVGLGQVQRWLGRPHEADSALSRALALQPGYQDAVEQRRWVRPELMTTLAPSVVYGTDSDRNSSVLSTVQAVLPPWGGVRATIVASSRTASFGAVEAVARTVRGSLAWTPHAGVSVRAEGGAASGVARRAGAETASRVRPVAAAGLALSLPRGIGLGLGASRAPFDETAPLIERGIVATGADLGVDVPLGGSFSASVSGGLTALSGGGVPNTRSSAGGGLRWRVLRGLSLAASQRSFGYARSPHDGYFAPRHFSLSEASARGTFGGELGWHVDAELGTGWQVLHVGETRAARAAERGALALGWRPTPGIEAALTVGAANVASPVAGGISASEYHAWNTGLRLRVPIH